MTTLDPGRGVRALPQRPDRPGSVARHGGSPARPAIPQRVRYDAIVNMGVTEHLPNYKATLRQYAELVKPGGHVYLDALAMRTKHRVSTFMSRYIYPGKSSPLVLHQYLRQVARSPFELVSVDDDRHNYHLTCARVGAPPGRGPRRGRAALGRPALPPVPAVPVGVGGQLRHGSGAGVPLGAAPAVTRRRRTVLLGALGHPGAGGRRQPADGHPGRGRVRRAAAGDGPRDGDGRDADDRGLARARC